MLHRKITLTIFRGVGLMRLGVQRCRDLGPSGFAAAELQGGVKECQSRRFQKLNGVKGLAVSRP